MRLSSKLVPFAIVGLLGCGGGDDASDGDDTSGTEGSSGPETTMVFPTTNEESGSSSGVDPTVTTMSGSESTDDTATDPESSSGADTGGGDVCAPAEGDNDCYACTKESCCDEMEMCVEVEPNCGCVLDCLGAIEDPMPAQDTQMCADQCDVDFNSILVPTMAVFTCQDAMCGGNNVCGGGGN